MLIPVSCQFSLWKVHTFHKTMWWEGPSTSHANKMLTFEWAHLSQLGLSSLVDELGSVPQHVIRNDIGVSYKSQPTIEQMSLVFSNIARTTSAINPRKSYFQVYWDIGLWACFNPKQFLPRTFGTGTMILWPLPPDEIYPYITREQNQYGFKVVCTNYCLVNVSLGWSIVGLSQHDIKILTPKFWDFHFDRTCSNPHYILKFVLIELMEWLRLATWRHSSLQLYT